jgi:hypothetical protein
LRAAPQGLLPGRLFSVAPWAARAIPRLFARNDIWCLPEVPIRNGRRADQLRSCCRSNVCHQVPPSSLTLLATTASIAALIAG